MKVNKNNSNSQGIIYDDQQQFTPVTSTTGNIVTGTTTGVVNTIKRPASLDLNVNNNKVSAKKQKLLHQAAAATPILETPDLQSLKFNTPDLEKFILSNNLIATPTPSIQQAVFPATKATTEQEDFSKGFVDALENLRKTESSQAQQKQQQQNPVNNVATAVAGTGMSGGSITYTNLDETFPIAIKDEPQASSISSPPLSPIDMETQEKIKLERKRQRNRVAASKCRKRKLERISKLEEKVKVLKGENADLGAVVKGLKEHIFQLKQEVIDHINSGCNIAITHGGSWKFLKIYFKGLTANALNRDEFTLQ